MKYRGNVSSTFSSNSESDAFSSELLENLEELRGGDLRPLITSLFTWLLHSERNYNVKQRLMMIYSSIISLLHTSSIINST